MARHKGRQKVTEHRNAIEPAGSNAREVWERGRQGVAKGTIHCFQLGMGQAAQRARQHVMGGGIEKERVNPGKPSGLFAHAGNPPSPTTNPMPHVVHNVQKAAVWQAGKIQQQNKGNAKGNNQ